MTNKQAIDFAKNALRDTFEPHSALKHIYYHAFGTELISARLNPKDSVDPLKYEYFKSCIVARCEGEPLQYILGHWDFAGFDFFTEKNVLIPRNDTEILLEAAKPFLDKQKILLDLCTGSGILGISLSLLTSCRAFCVDISDDSVLLANKNIKKLNAQRVTALKGDIFCKDSLKELPKSDIVVCNPPYIKSADMKNLQPEVKKEPALALDGGDSGLISYEALLKLTADILKKDGLLAVETGFDQGKEVSTLFKEADLKNIKIIKDLNGLDRVVTGTLS